MLQFQLQTKITVLLLIWCHLTHTQGEIKVWPFSFSTEVVAGESVTTSCSASVKAKTLIFKWLKNDREVSSSNNLKIVNADTYSALIFDSVHESDSGNYTCIVLHNEDSGRHMASLVVKAPPKWSHYTEDTLVMFGSNVTLRCIADGSPKPTAMWKHLNSNNHQHRELLLTSEELVLVNVTKDMEGSYECRVSNNVGPPLVRSILLTVTVPARFQEKFSIHTVRRGESATLKCPAKGDHPLTVTWLKDKQEITGDSRYEKFENEEKDGLNSELFVRSVERRDGSLYSCQAKNKYGSDDRNIKVVVVEVPSQVLDLRAQDTWSRSASIAWTSPYGGNSPITKYVIQYWRDKEAPHKLHQQEVPAIQTSATLTQDLTPGTSFAVTVTAENEIGMGEPSKEIQFMTGEEEPAGPPTDVWAEAKGSSTVEVQWKPPLRELWNGELKGYYIGFKMVRSSQSYSYKTVDRALSNTTMTYMLGDLAKSSKYSIVVKAFSLAGTGPASQEIVVKTLEGELPHPPDVIVMSASASTVSLKWEESDKPLHLLSSNHYKITGYTLHYKKDMRTEDWTHVPMVRNEMNRYTLTNLDSDTMYHMYVTASNQYGRGLPSQTLNVKTDSHGMSLKLALPFELDLALIIPVVAGSIAFLVVVIVIIIYVRKAKARRTLEKSLQCNKSVNPYMGTTQRYIDLDKHRSSIQGTEPGTPGSTYASYACIPSRDATLESRHGDSRHEMKTFLDQRNEKPPTYPRRSSLKKGQHQTYKLP